MSVLQVTNVRSNSTSFNTPVVFQTSGGTENGTLCRAWVNFNGTGTVAIRADFNVNSITDNTTGDYTVNFSNALADANYSPIVITSPSTASTARLFSMVFTNSSGTSSVTPSSSSFRWSTFNNVTSANYDPDYACVAVFR